MLKALYRSLSMFLVLGGAGLQAADITAAEYSDEKQQTIRFKVDGVDKDVTAPEGKYWEGLIVSKDKKTAFFVLCRGNKERGSWMEDLHRFSAEAAEGTGNPAKIPLKTDLKDAKILRIHDVSDDGSHLLADLHYMTRTEGKSSYFESYPYFINTADGTVAPVKAAHASAKAEGKEEAAGATAEFEFFHAPDKKYPLSKALAAHLAALVKTKPTTPAPGPSPNALPYAIITINGTGYTYFGSLWKDDKVYWKSPQLDEFWKFLQSHPAAEISGFEPGKVAKP